MLGNIEERIVEMRFDNAHFEKNAAQSMRTLDKLDRSLQLTDGVSGLDQVESALERVSDRLSTLGIIGATVVSNLTNHILDLGRNLLSAIPRQILSGGKQRALNIEQAKFQLEGINVAWEDIYDNIDKAVSGTAYGLDEAAKVAAQLAASGVAYGDAESDMAHALRGISGVAAMTNSSYEDIGSIFTTVASNGKLMTQQLRQFSFRGLNVQAKLAQALGKTEEEIGAMVTKGQIDFLTFARAMDDAFGEHATKANETFTGALSNMKAALSRIGADFATPTLTALRDVYNALRDVFNNVRKITRPFAEGKYTEWLGELTKKAIILIKKLDFSWLSSAINMIDRLGTSFQRFFSLQIRKEDGSFLSYDEFSSIRMRIIRLRELVEGFKAIVDIGKMAISALGSAIKRLSPDFGSMFDKALKASSSFAEWIIKLRDVIKYNDLFNRALDPVVERIILCRDAIGSLLQKFKDFFIETMATNERLKAIKNAVSKFFSELDELSTSPIGKKLSAIKEKIYAFFSFDGASLDVISFIFSKLGDILLGALTLVGRAVTGIFNFLKPVASVIKDFLAESGLNSVTSIVSGLISTLLGLVTADAVLTTKQNITALVGTIGKLPQMLKVIPTKINSILYDFQVSWTRFQAFLEANFRVTLVRQVATSVLILAVALKVLSSVDASALGNSILGVTVLLGELLSAMKIMGTLESLGDTIKIKGLKNLAFAVLELSAAVWLLAKIPEEKMWQGVSGAFVLLAAVVTALAVISKYAASGPMLAAGAAMIGVALAMIFMAGAIAILAAVPKEKLVQALEAIALSLLAIVFALALVSKYANPAEMLAMGAAIIGIGVAMLLVSGAIAALAFIPYEKMVHGLEALGIILAGIIVALAVITKYTNPAEILAGAAAILILAVGIDLLVLGIAVLSSSKVQEGFLAFAGVLIVVIIALTALASVGVMALVGAAAVLVLSVAIVAAAAGMILLATALNMLIGIPIADIGASLIVLGIGMAVLAVGCIAMGLGLIGAAALTVLAFGLSMLSGLDLPSMAGGLSLLGLAMIPLAIGSALLGLAAVPMLAASVAMAAMGSALIPFAFGLKQLDKIRIQAIGKYLIALGGTAVVIAALTPVLGPLAIALAAFGVAALGAGEGINLAGTGMQKIVDSILKIPDDAATKLKEMAKAMAAALQETGGAVTDEMRAIMDACFEVVSSYHESFVSVGEYVSAGIATGVARGAYRPIQTMDRLATAMQNRFATRMEIKSPSRVMERLAGFIPKGAANGVTDNMGLAADAMGQMGDQMITAISPALAILAGLLNGEFDIDPTIRPIVDLSDVSASASSISGMFAGAQTVSVSTAQSVNRRMNTSSTTESAPENQNGNSVQPAFAPVINVYPDPGMDEDALADKVINRMQDAYIRRGVALG